MKIYYTKILACFIFMNQSVYGTAFILSFYRIFIRNLDTSTWALPFSLIVPFNTETILGWYILFAIQFCIGFSYSICISTTTSYFISGCFYIDAICDNFDALIDSLKDDTQPNNGIKRSQPMELTKKMYESLEKKFRDAVEINVKLYEVFKLLADINSGSIFSLLLPNVIVFACTLFNAENSSAEAPVIIGYHIICVICSLTWPFLFCYFATFATYRIAGLSQTAYNSN